MTLQTLFVLIAAMTLNVKLSVVASSLYLLLGLAGLPIFASGGGIMYVLHPTFGYLLGFIAACFLTGFLSNKVKSRSLLKLFLFGLLGILTIYIFGTTYIFALSSFYTGESFSFRALMTVGFSITIIGDIIKCFAASLISYRLLPILANSNFYKKFISS